MKYFITTLFFLGSIAMAKSETIADFAAHRKSICDKHKTEMTKTVVPILYGEPKFDGKYEKAHSKLFPNANEGMALGGCIISSDSAKEAYIFDCAQCDKTRAEWLAKNKK